MKKSLTNLWLAATLACFSLNVFAFSADDHQAWLDSNQKATPQFVDGDVITFDKADLVRDELLKHGIILKDSNGATEWSYK